MKKPPVFGIVIWDDLSSSERETELPPCYKISIGWLTYKKGAFHILSEDTLSPGFEPALYVTRIKKSNIELIIPLKIDLPNIPDNLPSDLVTLLKESGLLNLP